MSDAQILAVDFGAEPRRYSPRPARLCKLRYGYTLIMARANTDDVAAVLRAALALPQDAREAVAIELFESLDSDDSFLQSDEWRGELNQRITEIDAGEVRLRDWQDVRRDVFGKRSP